jgi:murein DD-endopeptidase MepM/ murein hydrolase activator NlpD
MGDSKIGGLRIWLNGKFYYAHLSGFASGMKVGKKVKAGTVIGFVGNTGDAQGTPYHLHFGYSPDRSQGARWANPYPMLGDWTTLQEGETPTVDYGSPSESLTGPPGATPGAPPGSPPTPEPPIAEPPGSPPVPGGTGVGYPGEMPVEDVPEISPSDQWQTLANMPFSSPETQQWARRLGRSA